MKTNNIHIGVIGCGVISGIYLENCRSFDLLEVVAVADLDLERARAKAAQYGVPRACGVAELLADPEIDLIINLTIPRAHAEIGLAALQAGKSVYNEKPLAFERADARQMLSIAAESGLRLGGAPDTFMGGGLQTCRKLIDEGAIGTPVGVTAFMLSHGTEMWHPDPDFFYQPGGGPMFDMGPYYLTALVSLLGPVRRLTGLTRITFPERTITSEPRRGQTIVVNTPTHVIGGLEFASGAIGTIVTSFDVWGAEQPRYMEIYGSEGTLILPDPNSFGGPVRLRRAGEREWTEVPLSHGYIKNSRGLGVADMATALRSGRPHRASGELTYHVLDIMHGIHDAARLGRHVELESTCERPAPLPLGLEDWTIDL